MSIDPVRRAVLIDIAFEIGGAGLAGFKDMLAAIRAGKWATAAQCLKDSKLFGEVPVREQENLYTLATGLWPMGITTAQMLIKKHEGRILTAQPDRNGKWVIGIGHDIDVPEPGEPIPKWTDEQVDNTFAADFVLAEERAAADVGQDYW